LKTVGYEVKRSHLVRRKHDCEMVACEELRIAMNDVNRCTNAKDME